jgi:hypothetical protein
LAQDADLQLVSRALAAFALRGPPETVPQTAGQEKSVKERRTRKRR